MEVKFGQKNDDGEVQLVFTMPGAKRPTVRWFQNEASAINFTGFVGAQDGGITDAAGLHRFLVEAGFSEESVAAFEAKNSDS